MDPLIDQLIEDEIIFCEAVDTLMIAMLEDASASLHIRQPQHTRPFTGFQIITDILNGHPKRCYNMFRMSRENFHILCQKISSSLITTKTTAEEQLAIFLLCVGHGDSTRKLGEYYQHSSESIYRHFKDVLKAILGLHGEYIKLPDANAGIHHSVGPNSKNYVFKGALGAIGGTHIRAIIKKKSKERFRDRKGNISQNVLAACSFDMLFLYVGVGWEGSASDMKVLRWATEEGGFTVPNGRYYLADLGYANTSKFLCPFRNHTYHIGQFNNQYSSSRYAVPEDLYNHRHAKLRNVIERTFGVLKKRFKVLETMSFKKYRKQTLVVMACCIIHNFIRLQNLPDEIFDTATKYVYPHDNSNLVDASDLPSDNNEMAAGEIIKNNIKNTLWQERQARRRRN